MLFATSERVFAQAIVDLRFSNPFDDAENKRHEEKAFSVDLPNDVKNRFGPLPTIKWREHYPELLQRSEALAEVVRERVRAGQGNVKERDLYQELVLFVVYYRYRTQLQGTLDETLEPTDPGDADTASGSRRGVRVSYYEDFVRDLHYYLDAVAGAGAVTQNARHWFACSFQLRRAFALIDKKILGKSRPVARFRAAVWQSIFTHDLRRYGDFLFKEMHKIATLITGPSGTGKELVAEAIGLSRYVEFDARAAQFAEDFGLALQTVNLSALSPELIESELFGHCKGAFTGAARDRIGWLENCKRGHSIFLDEIGELSTPFQVKLLRVLQSRKLQRLGETETREFGGKVIAATNRDLGQLVAEGVFRRDFYFRLCSDLIRTPSLQEQLRDNPQEISTLVGELTNSLYGKKQSGDIADEVVKWIKQNLGLDYAWPGNMRELEQCIRNIVVRKEYLPLREQEHSSLEPFFVRIANMNLTADQLLNEYCKFVHSQTGSYVEAARRLRMDRRTLRARVAGWESDSR